MKLGWRQKEPNNIPHHCETRRHYSCYNNVISLSTIFFLNLFIFMTASLEKKNLLFYLSKIIMLFVVLLLGKSLWLKGRDGNGHDSRHGRSMGNSRIAASSNWILPLRSDTCSLWVYNHLIKIILFFIFIFSLSQLYSTMPTF